MGVSYKLDDKKSKRDGIQDFWTWFVKHEQKFFHTVKTGNQIDKNFFSKLSPKIDSIRKELYFLTGMYNDETAELVITPDGVVQNIAFVEKLVSAAPPLPNWKFTALKPAIENMEQFKIKMYGYSFDINDMFFYPIVHKYHPDEVDISIVHPDYTEENKDSIAHGVEVFLDNYIGELHAVITIDNLNVTSKDLATDELIPLNKLKAYLIWREKEFVEKYTEIRYDSENDMYTTFEGSTQNDLPILAMINTSLLEWNGKLSHPWMIIIRISYEGDVITGMPNQQTYQLMDKFEDELMNSFPLDIGYLPIGRETAENLREIYFACTEFRKSSDVIDHLVNKYEYLLEIKYIIYKDKYWKSFERFRVTID